MTARSGNDEDFPFLDMKNGTGMCGACRVEIDHETKFACVHGPQFDGHKVNFDLLMERQRIYLDDERISLFKSIK